MRDLYFLKLPPKLLTWLEMNDHLTVAHTTVDLRGHPARGPAVRIGGLTNQQLDQLSTISYRGYPAIKNFDWERADLTPYYARAFMNISDD